MTESGGGRGEGRSAGSWGQREPAKARALNHPLRRNILRRLHQDEEAWSPDRLAEVLDARLSKVSYHVRVLARLRTARLVAQEEALGAARRFYVSAVAEDENVLAFLEATRKSDEALEIG